MRNGADALMRQILSALGFNGFYWMGAIFFIGFLITYLFQKQYWNDIEIESRYLILMMIESCFWSIGLYLFMSNVYILLMNPSGNFIIQQVTLAVGAGIYEEFLFRVLLIAGIGGILGFIFQWNNTLRNSIAMIIAAGIFQHFILLVNLVITFRSIYLWFDFLQELYWVYFIFFVVLESLLGPTQFMI